LRGTVHLVNASVLEKWNALTDAEVTAQVLMGADGALRGVDAPAQRAHVQDRPRRRRERRQSRRGPAAGIRQRLGEFTAIRRHHVVRYLAHTKGDEGRR
jgi:hypothetical protein